MDNLAPFIAAKLMKIKAVKFQISNPFLWGTGWSSPIYCDDRKILSYPACRAIIKLEMARLIAEKYPDAEVIAGVASNAIAIGVLVAEELQLPFVYVHPEPKDHGFENRIEGDLRPRQKVVIIENQVSTGNNSVKVVDALRHDSCTVLGLVSIFDYQFPMAQNQFYKVSLEYTALCNFDSILKYASKEELINDADVMELTKWHKNPAKWRK